MSRRSALTLLLASGALLARPVSESQIHQAARAWLARNGAPLQATLGRDVLEVRTHRDEAGRARFHEVRLSPGGFLIMSSDDRVEPVIAFAEGEALDTSSESHLYLLLKRDPRLQPEALSAKDPQDLKLATPNPWKALVEDQVLMASRSSVTDVRVAPLVKSKWNQSTVSGYYVYNYFTPNHYVCGCVATAMAQLMRFHSYPTTGIGVKTFNVTVDKASQTLNTRGGDGSGGAYNWSLMPLVPNSSTTDAERQMIGALCVDAGAAVNMQYASDGSGAYMNTAATALRTTFKYSNAIFGYNGGELTGRGLVEMVNPNLDAGLPVLFGISGDGGHAIVCDGYGYEAGVLYHHLNMGWGGGSDAWYTLPAIGTTYHFNEVDECVYNVFQNGQGEILSGRVTDGANPMEGVSVTNGTVVGTTNAQGIFALKGITPGTQTLTFTKAGSELPSAMRLVGTSSNGPTVGNVWGVDVNPTMTVPVVQLPPQSQEVKLGGSVSFLTGVAGSGPLHLQWEKNGQPVGTADSLSYTLANTVMADDQAQIAVKVTGSRGTTTSPAATVSVVRLFNGHFELGNKGWTLYNNGVVLGPNGYPEVNPHGGSNWLCIGDWSQPTNDYATQDIELPAAGTASLSFWVGVGNRAATPSTQTNVFKVKILDTNNQVLRELQSLSNLDASVDANSKVIWKQYGSFSLNDWLGRTVRLRIESTQPGGKDTGTFFAVDDVVLTTSAPVNIALALNQGAVTALPGASVTYTVSGDGGGGVNWTVSSPATLASNGLSATVGVPSTAPLNTTIYTLTATSKLDGTKSISADITTKAMDLDRDGKIDAFDLLTLLGQWGQSSNSPSNLKGSGNVDDTDLAALLSKL
ncbi:MAG: C10 family peptidase [Firmicutes bacterium]|nr:C10 family peptidase [Bacillota bacterium]